MALSRGGNPLLSLPPLLCWRNLHGQIARVRPRRHVSESYKGALGMGVRGGALGGEEVEKSEAEVASLGRRR